MQNMQFIQSHALHSWHHFNFQQSPGRDGISNLRNVSKGDLWEVVVRASDCNNYLFDITASFKSCSEYNVSYLQFLEGLLFPLSTTHQHASTSFSRFKVSKDITNVSHFYLSLKKVWIRGKRVEGARILFLIYCAHSFNSTSE